MVTMLASFHACGTEPTSQALVISWCHQLKHHHEYKCHLFEMETVTLCVEVERCFKGRILICVSEMTDLLMPVCSLEHRPVENSTPLLSVCVHRFPLFPGVSLSLGRGEQDDTNSRPEY